MGRIFLIGDTHFGDELIVKCERDVFVDAHSMDSAITANWNEVVTDEDTVYVLGDFAKQGLDKDALYMYLKELKGRKRLVMGNHDNYTPEEYMTAGFEMVYDVPIILDGFWILSHEPLYITEKMPYANVYAHVHSNPNYKSVSSRGFCASVERIEYTPILFDDVKKAVTQAV